MLLFHRSFNFMSYKTSAVSAFLQFLVEFVQGSHQGTNYPSSDCLISSILYARCGVEGLSHTKAPCCFFSRPSIQKQHGINNTAMVSESMTLIIPRITFMSSSFCVAVFISLLFVFGNMTPDMSLNKNQHC